MKLYLLTTANLGDYYVLAATATEAENTLTERLNEADYSYANHRKVTNIKLIAEKVGGFNGKPFFSSKNRLII